MNRLHIWSCLILLAVSVSCFKDPNFESGFSGEDSGGRNLPERSYSEPSRRVMVMISAGFNSLSDYLASDLEELELGELPVGTSYSSDILMILSRTVTSSGNYGTPSPASLYRLYQDAQGTVCRDTLMVWDAETPLSSGKTIHEALSYVSLQKDTAWSSPPMLPVGFRPAIMSLRPLTKRRPRPAPSVPSARTKPREAASKWS